jgi:hypothetical protein
VYGYGIGQPEYGSLLFQRGSSYSEVLMIKPGDNE